MCDFGHSDSLILGAGLITTDILVQQICNFKNSMHNNCFVYPRGTFHTIGVNFMRPLKKMPTFVKGL